MKVFISDVRVVYSDISTGIVDIYVNPDGLPSIANTNQVITEKNKLLFHLRKNIIPRFSELNIRGVGDVEMAVISRVTIPNFNY